MSYDIYPSNIKGLTWALERGMKNNTLIQTSQNGYEVRVNQTANPIRTWVLTYEYIYGNWNSPNNIQLYQPYYDVEYMMGFWLKHYGQSEDFLYQDPTWNSIGPGILTTPWTPFTKFGVNMGILDVANHWQKCITAGTTGSSYPSFNHSGGTTTEPTGVQWQDMGVYASGFPNLKAQLQLWNDGLGNYYSPLQFNWGGLFYEDVTDLNPPLSYPYTGQGSIQVYSNGRLLSLGTVTSPPNHDCGIFGPGLAINGNSTAGLYISFYPWGTAYPPTPPITVTCNFLWRVRFDPEQQNFDEFMSGLFTLGGSNSKNSAEINLVTSRAGYYGP